MSFEGRSEIGQGIRDRYNRVKDWQGFGVLALVYIVVWFFLLVMSYLPWQARLDPKSWQGFVPENLVIAFVVFGLFTLPGMFCVVWMNLLRKSENRKT